MPILLGALIARWRRYSCAGASEPHDAVFGEALDLRRRLASINAELARVPRVVASAHVPSTGARSA